jgi:2-polyprenyl-3-methyl-5-hydroxy-6-metoxy-1,4-benzoquinol methylase
VATDWDASAEAWVALMRRGSWGRTHVVDPAMQARIAGRGFRRALDVGCGEGRVCRMLQSHGIATVGIDPTVALIAEARRQDPDGDYRVVTAEAFDASEGDFDLVVSCLSLIDIPDFRAAITRMADVLAPGGTLLIANLSNIASACIGQGWVNDADGAPLHHPVDRYLEEFPQWVEWAGIRVLNWHRPLSAYMGALLGAGLRLAAYEEPDAVGGDPQMAARHRRAPYFVLMEWTKPLR